MNVINHHVTFNNATLLLSSQFVKDRAKLFSDLSKQDLTPILRNKDEMVLTIPPRMGQALISVFHLLLLRCSFINLPQKHFTPATLKALRVALVKPVAYLNFELAFLLKQPLARNGPGVQMRICTPL